MKYHTDSIGGPFTLQDINTTFIYFYPLNFYEVNNPAVNNTRCTVNDWIHDHYHGTWSGFFLQTGRPRRSNSFSVDLTFTLVGVVY